MDGPKSESQELKLRLRNCLQTILEFKGDLDAIPFGMSFMPEFGSLENFLSQLEQVALDEAEVRRIELATDNFLSELKTLVENSRVRGAGNTGVLH